MIVGSHLNSVQKQGPGQDKVNNKNIKIENHVSPFHVYCDKILYFKIHSQLKPGCPLPSAWQRVFLNSRPPVNWSPVIAFVDLFPLKKSKTFPKTRQLKKYPQRAI